MQRRSPHPGDKPFPPGWTELLAVFVLFGSIFCLTHSGFDSSEGMGHYKVAELIIREGALGFEQPQDGIFSQAPNGRTYASHEIGNTLFLLPAAALNGGLDRFVLAGRDPKLSLRVREFFASLQSAICAALIVTVFYSLLRADFGLLPYDALLASSMLAFTTYLWSYSRSLFDGVLCALVLLVSFQQLFRFGKTQSTSALVGAFAALGFGVITRLTMLLPLVAAVVYVTMRLQFKPRPVARAAIVAACILIPFAAWQLWYNHLRTGNCLVSPVQTAQYAYNNGLTGNTCLGLAGYLVSPGKSIFLYAPALVLSVGFFPSFWRTHRDEAIFILIVSALWLLLHATLQTSYTARGPGPRLLLTILPLWLLPAAVQTRQILRAPQVRWIAAALCLFGFVLSAAEVATNWHYDQTRGELRGISASEYAWSLRENQTVDTLRTAGQNLKRWAEHGPLPKDGPAVSPENRYTSNSLNFWENTMWHAGVPVIAVLAASGMLAIIALVALVYLLRLARRAGVAGEGA
jgi:hypothetical protein